MIERFAEIAEPVLESAIVRRTRRNHGLEHATIHILSSRIRNLKMAGRSNDGGFVLVGEADTAAVERAVHDALRRMQNGEHGLAVHPNCGTNLVTTGFMATMAATLTLSAGRRVTLDRIAWAMMAVTAATLWSQPVGTALQKHVTTKGDPGDLEVVDIRRREIRNPLNGKRVTLHQVITQRG